MSDYSGGPPGGHAFNPNAALPAHAPLQQQPGGGIGGPQQPPPPPGHAGPASLQQSFPGDTGTVIYKPDGVNPAPPTHDPPPAVAPKPRGPLPQPEYDQFPPPPPMRPNGANGPHPPNGNGNGNGSADVSLNDSNSTTQSNLASECSEAECDREPLVKQGDRSELIITQISSTYICPNLCPECVTKIAVRFQDRFFTMAY